MPILEFENHKPEIDPSAFVADQALVIGDVIIGSESSVWYYSILRGDVCPIRVGKRTNIQDLTMGHVTAGTHPLILGDDITIGHRVVVHGCRIHDCCLIGMGTVILDGAEIGPESVVGAGAVVTPKTIIPPRTLALGSPARVKRELKPEEIKDITRLAQHYVALAKAHQKSQRVLR